MLELWSSTARLTPVLGSDTLWVTPTYGTLIQISTAKAPVSGEHLRLSFFQQSLQSTLQTYVRRLRVCSLSELNSELQDQQELQAVNG